MIFGVQAACTCLPPANGLNLWYHSTSYDWQTLLPHQRAIFPYSPLQGAYNIVIIVQIRTNQITIEHNGIAVEHRGTFSNSRIIVASFQQFVNDLQAALKQAADKKIYTPPSKLTGRLLSTPVCIDVREELAGGLTQVEAKCLYDCLLHLNAVTLKDENCILYQGQPWANIDK